MTKLPSSWLSILGFQFENLVIKNKDKLFKLLNIDMAEIVFANPYFQKKTSQHRGCQIDYLIQTKFNTLYLCDIKFKRDEITTDILEQINVKIKNLKIPTGFSIRPVLIHFNGIKDELIETDYFSKIINFEDFL